MIRRQGQSALEPAEKTIDLVIRLLFHLVAVALLTAVTQVGGIAWLGSLWFRWRLVAFAGLYLCLHLAAQHGAPLMGRVPLPCDGDGPVQVKSLFYCAANRNFVTPELRDVIADLANHMQRTHPGTVTVVLDAGFPFANGFPLLPHLSHDDGQKADIAFWYQQDGTYLPGATRSPLGYFAFEPGVTDCPAAFPTLRWDLAYLQPLWRAYGLDQGRMRSALRWLLDDPRVGKLFLEPHLQQSLGITHPKLRFQGCRAARHDDHLHIEL